METGFNSSVWNAFIVLSPFGAGMFSFVIYKAWRYNDWHHLFDPKHNKDSRLQGEGGDFSQHWSHYEGLAKLVVTLSAGALAFLISTVSNQRPPLSQFSQRLTDVTPIVVGFFGASILFLILFLLWMAYRYEDYCHTANHDSYRAWQYAMTVSLGVMGFVAFVCGFGWLGVNLFRQT
jgi:hypothetical protein